MLKFQDETFRIGVSNIIYVLNECKSLFELKNEYIFIVRWNNVLQISKLKGNQYQEIFSCSTSYCISYMYKFGLEML